MGMGTTFNQGQLAQLGNNINIAVATALPDVAAKYDPKSLLKAMEGRGQFVADKLGPALEEIFNSLFVLGTPCRVNVTLTEPHDPDMFYRTRSGLYVYERFRNLVVAKAKPVEAGTIFTLDHALLTQNMTDEKIEASLPKHYIFDETSLCSIIAAMIAEQQEGKEGKLLNNGYANLFYTASCVVRVGWYAGDREWSVGAWKRDDDAWSAGDRAFSPATAA